MIDDAAEVDDVGLLSVSPAQESMWFALQLTPDPAYHVPYRVQLDGPLDAGALRAALGDLVAQHDALRASFPRTGTELRQRVRSTGAFTLRVTDLVALPPGAATTRAEELAREPFDLAGGPLLRAELLRLAPDRHELILVVHHLVFDGGSARVFFAQLAEAYAARAAHRIPELPQQPVAYPDLIDAQRIRPSGVDLAYWRNRLRDMPPPLALPGSPAPGTPDGLHRVRLTPDLADRVRVTGRRHRCTSFMTMLAAFAVLLRTHTGRTDVVIGSPAADRRRPETAHAIGLFVNMLPLRVTMTDAPAFADVLAGVRDAVLDGFGHQVPVEDIIRETSPARSGHSPLFQAVFWLHPAQAEPPTLGDCRTTVEEIFTGAAKYDLTLGVRETPNGTVCDFFYRGTVLDPAGADRLANAYVQLLAALTDPDAVLPSLPPPALTAATATAATATAATATARPIAESARLLAGRIAEVWREVLDVPVVGSQDNFFDLGGHSRLMLRVQGLLAERLGTDVSMLDLFDHPTVAALAGHLAATAPPETSGDDPAERRRAGALRLRQAKGRPE
ncbi:condensation domain-containing protein [Salinispora sp. H7-4]|uniref:condensation domain-containing protein n=1 Tax=Salinispora sp. H7-4 TaxID=2748321 RepID=UPI001C556709|nr:condensation domain-containing protein [Salinispora sp. H7-4]